MIILGHSLGGVIGLALASGWFAVAPHHVLTIGVNCSWLPSDLDLMAELAARPAKAATQSARA